jgi:hypothetical protein
MDDGVIFVTGLAFLQAAGNGEGHIQPKSRNILKNDTYLRYTTLSPPCSVQRTKVIGSSTAPLPLTVTVSICSPFTFLSSFAVRIGRTLYNSCILGIDLQNKTYCTNNSFLVLFL